MAWPGSPFPTGSIARAACRPDNASVSPPPASPPAPPLLNAAIHHPSAPGLAILGLDPLQEVAQCRLVRGVAWHHLVSQRQTVWCHDQGDDHLDAVGPFVPALAMAPLTGFGWIA